MKLKLKVTKTLKRDLKTLAEKASMERSDFVLQQIMAHLDENKSIWEAHVDGYPALLESRVDGLNALKTSLEESELSTEEQLAQLKAYYKTNHMYRVFYSKKRKFENIIINLDDTSYYGLCLIGESHHQAIETYTTEFLEKLTKQL